MEEVLQNTLLSDAELEQRIEEFKERVEVNPSLGGPCGGGACGGPGGSCGGGACGGTQILPQNKPYLLLNK
jgi:hypothetical protein